MTSDDLTIVRVGHNRVGIIGLKKVFEETARTHKGEDDAAIRDELVNRLAKKNYIPEKIKDLYGEALLGRFKSFMGKAFDADEFQTLEIKVLGPGCTQCDGLEKKIIELLTEMDVPADLEHVRDIKTIGQYGVMGTPALIINGRVMAVGKVPSKVQIKDWINKAKP